MLFSKFCLENFLYSIFVIWSIQSCDLHTAMKFRLYTIADIWSKVGVLWGGLMSPKHPAKPFSGWLPKGEHQSFPMRYYMTLYLKVLQNCGPSKFAPAGYRTRACAITTYIKCSLEPKMSAFFDRQLWRSAVWQPLEIQRLIIPHWKGLITGYCLVRQSGAWQWF